MKQNAFLLHDIIRPLNSRIRRETCLALFFSQLSLGLMNKLILFSFRRAYSAQQNTALSGYNCRWAKRQYLYFGAAPLWQKAKSMPLVLNFHGNLKARPLSKLKFSESRKHWLNNKVLLRLVAGCCLIAVSPRDLILGNVAKIALCLTMYFCKKPNRPAKTAI